MGSRKTNSPVVAYFLMEIAVMPSVPTYAGGLGVLAGDTLRAAADLEVPIVGVTLLHQRRFRMASVSGYEIPIFFLDTDLPENQPWDRRITDVLYGGGEHYRLRQEIVLGLGGVRLLRALGYEAIARFHRNEGHAAPPAWFGSTSMRSTSRRP